MPQGHTIHRAALDQRPMLLDKILDVASPQGRFAEGAKALDGKRCVAVEAYGKHMLYHFEQDRTLHIHLGLYGKFRAAKVPAPEPRGAVRVRMRSDSHVLYINGPNTCEVLDGAGVKLLFNRIGPDVLRSDADPELAWTKISVSRSAFGQLIMDQSVIAGIGNIYRTEILWRQNIHPERQGKTISRAEFDLIWNDAVLLLKIGVKHNAIITVDRGRTKTSKRCGEGVNIFAKEKCPVCSSAIRKFELATRRVFSCESCQVLI